METREIEVTKIEKIYELTETEYNDLINKERQYGCDKARGYLAFCYDHYYYKKDNLGGIFSFIKDLCSFLCGNDYIPNTREWSLFDWLKHNR